MTEEESWEDTSKYTGGGDVTVEDEVDQGE